MDKYLLIFGMSHLYFNFLMENDIYFEYNSVCVFFFYMCVRRLMIANDIRVSTFWFDSLMVFFFVFWLWRKILRNVNWALRHLSEMSLVWLISNICFKFKTNSPRPSTCSYTRNIGKTIINRFSNGTWMFRLPKLTSANKWEF